MALDFSASTHKVLLASDTSLDDLDTYSTWQWIWADTDSADMRVWQKGYFGAHGTSHYLAFNTSASGRLDCVFNGDHELLTDRSAYAAYGTGKWLFVVTTVSGSTASLCRIFVGDLTSPPAEPSSYVLQTGAGASASSDAAASLCYGQRDGDAAQFDGKIALAGWSNTLLTANEIYGLWWGHRPSTGVLWEGHFGLDGASTVYDKSGNGINGTVTGAALSAHVPRLNPFSYGQSPANLYATSAAANRRRRLLFTS